jgi:hypothetical protein
MQFRKCLSGIENEADNVVAAPRRARVLRTALSTWPLAILWCTNTL